MPNECASDIFMFATPDRFLQYTLMAFSMCYSPATFQRLINTVLSGLSNCNAYLDYIIVHTIMLDHHLQIIEQIFTHLADASLKLNLAKCDFSKTSHLLW